MIEEITRFLKGGYDEIKNELDREMEAAAEKIGFERAKNTEIKLFILKRLWKNKK